MSSNDEESKLFVTRFSPRVEIAFFDGLEYFLPLGQHRAIFAQSLKRFIEDETGETVSIGALIEEAERCYDFKHES